jgi:hypothetical protein
MDNNKMVELLLDLVLDNNGFWSLPDNNDNTQHLDPNFRNEDFSPPPEELSRLHNYHCNDKSPLPGDEDETQHPDPTFCNEDFSLPPDELTQIILFRKPPSSEKAWLSQIFYSGMQAFPLIRKLLPHL